MFKYHHVVKAHTVFLCLKKGKTVIFTVVINTKVNLF